MLYNLVLNMALVESQQAIITLIVSYATIASVLASVSSAYVAFKRFKKDQNDKMATKTDVGVLEDKLGTYIKAHEEIHTLYNDRVKEMHKMVQFLYQAEISRKNK